MRCDCFICRSGRKITGWLSSYLNRKPPIVTMGELREANVIVGVDRATGADLTAIERRISAAMTEATHHHTFDTVTTGRIRDVYRAAGGEVPITTTSTENPVSTITRNSRLPPGLENCEIERDLYSDSYRIKLEFCVGRETGADVSVESVTRMYEAAMAALTGERPVAPPEEPTEEPYRKLEL